MYELPGTLLSTGGIGIAAMSWGAFLALVNEQRATVLADPTKRFSFCLAARADAPPFFLGAAIEAE
jgi:hypothetical protein